MTSRGDSRSRSRDDSDILKLARLRVTLPASNHRFDLSSVLLDRAFSISSRYKNIVVFQGIRRWMNSGTAKPCIHMYCAAFAKIGALMHGGCLSLMSSQNEVPEALSDLHRLLLVIKPDKNCETRTTRWTQQRRVTNSGRWRMHDRFASSFCIRR